MSDLSALLNEVKGLPADVINHLVWEARSARKSLNDREYWLNLCENGTREDIIKAAQEYAGCHAIGLASDYSDLHYERELVAWAVHYHPRRPVLMKGSRAWLIAAHQLSSSGNPNGYCIELFWRCFRMMNVTAFCRDDLPDWLGDLRLRIRDRYGSITSSFFDATRIGFAFSIDGFCYINGVQKLLMPSEFTNLSKLYGIIKKTEKLEDRIKAANLHWKARMSEQY